MEVICPYEAKNVEMVNVGALISVEVEDAQSLAIVVARSANFDCWLAVL
jgi:hypothetical protein